MLPSPLEYAPPLLWLLFFLYWWAARKDVKRTARAEPRGSRALHLGLFGVAFAFALGSRPGTWGFLSTPFLPDSLALGIAGILLMALGVGFAIWARRELGRNWSGTVQVKEGHELIRTGPYALARHPIYTGILLGFVGDAIAIDEVRGLLAIACILIAYAFKIPHEERFMRDQFGAAYDEYRQKVKALLPFIL